MSTIHYIIQANFIDLTIVLFIYLFLLTNHTMSKLDNIFFLITAVILTVLIASDSLDFYMEQMDTLYTFRYVTTAVGYTLRPIPIMLLATLLKRGTKSKLTPLYIAAIVNGILAFTSIVTNWMFYYDEQNNFYRGPVWFVPFLISGIYLICLLIWSFERYYFGDKKEVIIMLFIAFMSVVAVLAETFFHLRFIINGVGACATVFYYLFLHTQTYKRDALTWAFNRHAFYTDSEQLVKQHMVVVSLDINNLKLINDTKGHDKGDLVILTVHNVLRECFSKKGIIYRMGGDEFIILCPKLTMEDVLSRLKKAEQKLSKYNYQIAYGIETFIPNMSLTEIVAKSDAKMYEDKKNKKKLAAQR